MKRAAIRSLAAIGLALLGGSVSSSCSTPSRSNAEHLPVQASSAAARAMPIAQQGFGRRTRFVSCTPPACPTVTPKTLASEGAAPEIAIAPVDTRSSLRPGEAMVSTPDRVTSLPAPQASPTPALSEPNPVSVTRQVTVLFSFGSAVLSPAAQAMVDEAAALPGTQRIAIRGRTDNVGSSASNGALARARADAVQRHLRARHPHLAKAQLTLDAQGACCFTAPNETPEGRARNRRVEIVFGRDAGDQ